MLRGKTLSILGDSVSTYRGVSNNERSNSTIAYNKCFYSEPFPLEKTYWKIVSDTLGLELCVNNSWSGGNLSGRYDEDSGVNRAYNLSRDDGTDPDIIIVFMGLNDLGRGIDQELFASDYCETLRIIKEKYPDAAVCCINLPDRDIRIKNRTEIFNSIIENAVEQSGENFFIADLFRSRLNNDFYYDNTLDGLHPDEDGMRIISEIVIDAIRRHICK